MSGGSAPIPLKREHMGVGDISESVVRHPQAWCLKDPGRRGSMGHPLAGTREGQRTTRASRPVEDAAGEGIGEADPCSLTLHCFPSHHPAFSSRQSNMVQ